jgi:hypothetical protein
VSTHDLPPAKLQPFIVHDESEEQPKVYLVLLPAHTLSSSQPKHYTCMSVAILAGSQQVV